jgi:lipopolysaccharide/colanic/teichoic acid biosynthesis glycosyltransferase
MKRIFDLLSASIGLLLLSPLFAVAAVLIKLDDPGPVFFRQERMGRGFRPFLVYKFRTMVQGAHRNGPLITSGGDSRVTRIGGFLRRTKIDELPQLINVLTGDMSIVGPRPEVRKYVEAYRQDYETVLSVRPGITDIASLTYRDEEALLRSQADPERFYLSVHLPAKIRLAKEYIRDRSFLYDLKLIFKTLHRVVAPEKVPDNQVRA